MRHAECARMNVIGVQLDSAWEDPHGNFAKVDRLLAGTPPSPGGLVVLPEMFSTGFSFDLSKTVQSEAREAEEFLRSLARRYDIAVLGGVVNSSGKGRGRNEAVAFAPDGSLLARYAKQRPFSGAGEDLVHEAGFETVTFGWGGFTVAPFVCYDLRFPELFRSAVQAGADLLVVIAAWPAKRIEHWLTLLRARAIENQAWVVGVNRCGTEPLFDYNGRSIVVDPLGTVVADAGESEGVFSAAVDAAAVRAWREEFPALRDARWGA